MSITQRIIRRGQRVGMLISYLEDGRVHIGYSLCSKADKYDKVKAEKIALSRAATCWDEKGIRLAHSIRDDFTTFYGRCERYYKDAKFPEVLTIKNDNRIDYYGIKHREDIH